MQVLDFGEHPRLVVVAGDRHGLVDADHRDAVRPRERDERFGQRVGHLLVVDERLDLVLSEQAALDRDVLFLGTADEEVVFRVSGDAPMLGPADRLLTLPIIRAGRPVDDAPTLEDSRRHLRAAMVSLPWEGLKLSRGDPALTTTLLGA